MKKLTIAILTLLSLASYGQYTRPESDIKMPTVKDTIATKKQSGPMTIDMQLYNEAYDAYLRKLQYKQRTQYIVKNTGLTFTQTAFDNWAGGGVGSFSLRAAANLTHNYVAPVFNISTTFDGAMSYIYSDNENVATKFSKSEDYFNLSTTPSWAIAPRWQFSSSVVIKSQFANSFRDEKVNDSTYQSVKTSTFFAPGTITLSAGITYVSKNGNLKVYMAPISGNMTIIANKELADKGGLGLPAGDQFGNTFGAFLRVNYNVVFAKKKMNYTSKLESFWGYDELPNFTLENWLSFKFTDLLAANLYVKAYYNDKVLTTPRYIKGDRGFMANLQLQETLTFGLTYNFTGKNPDPTPVVSNNRYLKASPKRKGRRVEQ